MKNPTRFILAYLVTGVVFLALDAIWLTIMGPRLYRPALGPLLAAQPNLTAAILFYAVYFLGLVVFTVRPAEAGAAWGTIAVRAALFGLVAYGTYDFTNQATLVRWSWSITCWDLVWGAAVTTLATLASRVFIKPFSR